MSAKFQPIGFADGQAWARAILSINWEKEPPLQSTLDSLIEIGRRSDCYDDLLAACRDALRTMRVAVRAGMEGFSQAEEDQIVENHGTVKELREAIEKATGKAVARA